MSSFRRRMPFTLPEVIVAATILAMAVAFTMGIIGTARAQVLRAERRWGRQHIMTQATEYFLLAGHRGREIPDGLLPDGFSAECSLVEVDDLPEEALEPTQEWMLGEFIIRVTDPEGGELGETRVRKVLKEEDFE